jgi:phospholipid-binding lipoprotein MlaA
MHRTRAALLLAILVNSLLLLGCASLPPNYKRDPRDPWERMNRTTFKVNTALDHAIARPIARGYEKITPRPVRDSVSNFVDNLRAPITIGNDLLQLKFKWLAQDIGRFVLNTTVGVGGLFDPATQAGLPKNDQDLGLTFGHWGSGPGPYFVIPILGPSNVRDGIGRVGDIWLSPTHYIDNNYISYGLDGLWVLDARYRLLPQDHLLEEAYDPYTLLKNAYLQRRQFQVESGRQSQKQQQKQEQQQIDEEKRILEEAGPDDSASPPPQGQPPQGTEPPKSP